MRQKPYTSYNPFFLIPFVLWIVAGGFLLYQYDAQTLFSAINSRHTSTRDTLMYEITRMGEGGIIAAVLLVLWGMRRFRGWWFFVTALLCTVLPALVVQLLKRMFDAPRPLLFFKDADWIHVGVDWPKYYHHSFPSGHTTGAFSFFCLLACLLPPGYRYLGLIFWIAALLVGYSRVYLAAHFFADVYVGSLAGTCVMLVGLALMRRVGSPAPGTEFVVKT